jgi:hypothetical protein
VSGARPAWLGLVVGIALVATGCGGADTAMPRCRADQRLAIVSQSVPDAAYLPCIAALPTGWSFQSLDVDDEHTRMSLRSDRSDRPVHVSLLPRCEVRGATPIAPRDEGVRTYQSVESIAPRYAGRLYDVFAHGCVVYEFDFARGPHIALIDELERTVSLYPRRELRQRLRDDLGIDLGAAD